MATINNITRQIILAELLDDNHFFGHFKRSFPDTDPKYISFQLGQLVKAKCITLSNAGIYQITDYGSAIIKNHIARLVKHLQTQEL